MAKWELIQVLPRLTTKAKNMGVLRTWGTLNLPSLSSCSAPAPAPPKRVYASFLNFSGARSILGNTSRTGCLSLSLHSSQPLRKAKFSMAESHSSDASFSSIQPDCTEIIVVRHGETAWNADGRIQGHLDVELNESGRQQAAAVADRLSKEPKISVIYSSDLQRASETAQIIATSCGGLEVVKDPDLRERHLGDLQGLVLREAAKLNTKPYMAFLSHSTEQEIPGGGESLDQLYQRCTSALERMSRKHQGERVVVVTHGGVIRALYKRTCPNGKSGGKVLNTSINIFHLYNGDKWTLKAWGDVSHLKQTGFLQSGFGGDKTSG